MKTFCQMFGLVLLAPSLAIGRTSEIWREAPPGVPGAVLVTSTERGDVLFECVGYADVAARSRMTPDTVFWMASNTKGVAAALALSVVAEGKLSLDDPVERYFPSWRQLAATNRPTLRMLLSHTAGLPFFTDRPLPRPGMDALAERAAEQPLAYEPGTCYRYSNWGIDVAMAMVEKVTGRPFEIELAERILKPLGMEDTSFVPSDDQITRQAVVYRLDKGKSPKPTTPHRGLAAPYERVGEYPEGGGGLLSTPRDMIRFFRMIADGGKTADGKVIIPSELMDVWLTNQVAGADVKYSLGMLVDGKGGISHGGSAGTWGEANPRLGKARLFMVNVEGNSPEFDAFRRNWKRVTVLHSKHLSYPSCYLARVDKSDCRKKLIDELWAHDPSAETRIWPDGKVPLRRDDRPLCFVEKELWQRNLVVTDINDPFFVFYPAGTTNAAPVVVVLPGGSYRVLGWNKEGTEIARWLNSLGISAAVLLYRAPDQRQAALCDVQRTIGLLRHDAARYGIDTNRVGVIGFSAGANLAVAASTNWRQRAYERVDAADDVSCRPDFQLPIYLWEVLSKDTRQLRKEYPVDSETPPAFLAQSKDDFCKIDTSVGYLRALESAGVQGCRLHQFEYGGHGYGLRRLGCPTDVWSDLAAEWLSTLLRR